MGKSQMANGKLRGRQRGRSVVAGSYLLFAICHLPFLSSCASTPAPNASLYDQTFHEAMVYAQEAQAAEQAGNHERAIELGRKALTLRPDLKGAWTNLGLALMHRGHDTDFIDAAQAFKKDADLLPGDERPYQNLGVLYHDRGFSDEALRYFTMALERNPNSLESLRGAIGSAKLLRRSDDQGLDRINRALMMETDPDWRKIDELEKLRVQQDLAERSRGD
jgi:tetratricopeptide (TPR) repeat protein